MLKSGSEKKLRASLLVSKGAFEETEEELGLG
jgi:hypothetical protein